MMWWRWVYERAAGTTGGSMGEQGKQGSGVISGYLHDV